MTIYEQSISAYPVESPLSRPIEDGYFYPGKQRATAVSPHQRMVIILGFVALVVLGFTFIRPRIMGEAADTAVTAETGQTETAVAQTGGEITAPAVNANLSGGISPVFSPQVQHWAPQIVSWASQYDLDPDIVATIMQIESCGDPQAVSHAGAQGLFQVMPFHFSPGEEMLDPDTNARRGMAYYAERLQQTGGDVFQAFAGYNGGHVAAAGSWDSWANETQRYYVWSKGIYEDAKAGLSESPTLQQWMQAGGAGLCQQASNRLALQ